MSSLPLSHYLNRETALQTMKWSAVGALNVLCFGQKSYPWTIGVYLGCTLLKEVAQEKLVHRSWKILLATGALAYFSGNKAAIAGIQFLIGAHIGSQIPLEKASPPEEPSIQASDPFPRWKFVKSVVATVALGALNALCWHFDLGLWGAGFVIGSVFIPDIAQKRLVERVCNMSLSRAVPTGLFLACAQAPGSVAVQQFLIGVHLGSLIATRKWSIDT